MHVGAAAVAMAHESAWPFSLAAVAANHLTLAAAGLWPRSRLLGPNRTRLPAGGAAGTVILTLDDGPDPEVTTRVLDTLDAHDARATFFCIGERVMRHAGLARAIVARGHEIHNHSHSHSNLFAVLGPRGLKREVQLAQQAIREATGQVPLFFRAPAGLRNPFLEPVLADAGLELVSWTRRGFDTVSRRAEVVLRRLTRDLAAGDILLLHDGNSARTSAGNAVVLEVLPALLAQLRSMQLQPVTLGAALTRAPAGAASASS